VFTTAENLDDLTIFFRSMHMLEPGKQRAIHTERRRYHELFRGMVEEGQRTGVFRPDIAADLVVDYFFGAVHHLPTWFRPSGRPAGWPDGRSARRTPACSWTGSSPRAQGSTPGPTRRSGPD